MYVMTNVNISQILILNVTRVVKILNDVNISHFILDNVIKCITIVTIDTIFFIVPTYYAANSVLYE